MKICLVITGLTMGGAERQVCDLADQFVRMGHEVKLISLNRDPVVLPQSGDIRVSHLYFKKTFFGLIAGVFRLRKEIRAFNPDVVHSHMVHANVISRVLRIITPMNVLICTAHNTNEGGTIRQLLYRYTDALSTISTNVTQEAVDTYIRKKIAPAGRMIAVVNGLDESKFKFSSENRDVLRQRLGIDRTAFLFLAVGRLEEQKDYPNLLHAFALLCKRQSTGGVGIHLAIIGDGVLRGELESLVNDLELSNKVSFLNSQFNVEEWMSACDAYVLSSAWEGFGLVAAEAMLCERVVVATDCGGVKEVLEDHGCLVPSRSTERLADGMRDVMNMGEEHRARIGIEARAHVIEKYSLSRVAERWIDIYNGVDATRAA